MQLLSKFLVINRKMFRVNELSLRYKGYQTIIPDIISLKYLNTGQNKKDQKHFTGKVPPFPKWEQIDWITYPWLVLAKTIGLVFGITFTACHRRCFYFYFAKKMFFTLIQTKSVSTDIFVFYFFTFFKKYFYFFELKSL